MLWRHTLGLEVQGLSVHYGQSRAVNNVSFALADGEMLALVGANGAGKTSTLLALAGLVSPSDGDIVLDGKSITGMKSHQMVEQGIVLVPEGRAIVAHMTVRENLLLAGKDVDEIVARFPILSERWQMPGGSLSGGEQQMLAIARGLVSRPRILLLDEPSLGLAPKLVKQVFKIADDIRSEGTTVLLVEQNAQEALTLADRGLVLESGALVLEGLGADLLQDDQVLRAYMGGGLGEAESERSQPPARDGQ